MDKVQKIREEIESLFNHVKNSNLESDSGAFYYLRDLLDFIDSLQEEHVSEFLNTESMIESYKQRLISQANSMKNNPLIGMCLVSYKHGINDALDTLNISNVQRTIKSCKEETVSEDLMEAAKAYSMFERSDDTEAGYDLNRYDGFIAGAQWQKEHLWKPADGNDLPEIDKEVIVLCKNGRIAFGHRPNPDGWEGKSITTGEVEHYTPKTYGKGGWNIPDIVYWLDVELSKEIEP